MLYLVVLGIGVIAGAVAMFYVIRKGYVDVRNN